MSRFVLDASIVLTWCFPDENSPLADHVISLFKNGGSALVPSFWPHEVLNALLMGEKRKRISQEAVESFLSDLAILPISLDVLPAQAIFEKVQHLSREHSLTAYDAAYLDLAVENRLALATLDESLITACKKSGTPLIEL